MQWNIIQPPKSQNSEICSKMYGPKAVILNEVRQRKHIISLKYGILKKEKKVQMNLFTK